MYREEEWLQIEEQIEEWIDDFMISDEFLNLSEEEEDWVSYCISSFAEYMYLFLEKKPKTWGVEEMKKICLDLMPRHVRDELEVFEALGPILYHFFSFLEREEILPNARSLKIGVKRIESKIVVQAKDRSRWGLSKTSYFDIYPDGIEDDSFEDPFVHDLEDPLDDTSPEKLMDLFILLGELLKEGRERDDENENIEDLFSEMMGEQISSKYVPFGSKKPRIEEEEEEVVEGEDMERRIPKTIVKGHQVGRNDPCPCGSGKKYKKCCL